MENNLRGTPIVGGECYKIKRERRSRGRYLNRREVRALRKHDLLAQLVYIFSVKARAIDAITCYSGDEEAGYQQIADDVEGLYLEDEKGRLHLNLPSLTIRLNNMQQAGQIDEDDVRIIVGVLSGKQLTKKEWQGRDRHAAL